MGILLAELVRYMLSIVCWLVCVCMCMRPVCRCVRVCVLVCMRAVAVREKKSGGVCEWGYY